jgi:hypothetical protein
MEPREGLEPPLRDLQSRALPFGYRGTGIWSGRRASIPRPPAWRAGALPTELRPHFVEPPEGFEPPSTAVETRHSAPLSYGG